MSRVEQFIRERQYLQNAAPRTIESYHYCLPFLPNENPTQAELSDMVISMRQKGRKEAGCNIIIRTINAYLHWASGREGRCGPGCNHPKAKKLKEAQTVMPTFTQAQIEALIRYKPRTPFDRRLHLLTLLLLDTGCRISEALKLRVSDVDLDNLLVKLDGKGRKQRVVPFSMELRTHLFRTIKDTQPGSLLLGTSKGTVMLKSNTLRYIKRLCRDLGFEPPVRTLHSFRHTFAVNYLRRGGSTFHLQRSLGHSTLEMTRRYANLNTEDLQAVHPRISLLKPNWRRNQ
jgi:integrase/recombinase XerD